MIMIGEFATVNHNLSAQCLIYLTRMRVVNMIILTLYNTCTQITPIYLYTTFI